MKLITKKTDYAIRVLLFMSKNNGHKFTANQLSKKLEIPWSFLRGVLQILNKHGILTSYKGKAGGFKLNISSGKIYIRDLIKIFQGNIELNQCFIKQDLCPDIETCVLREKIEEIENYIDRQLDLLNIKSLLKHGGKNE